MATANQQNNNNLNNNLEEYVMAIDDSEQEISKNNTRVTSSIHERGDVPESHRIIADNYMILKKIYGKPVVASKLTIEESNFLRKYNFAPLEICSSAQMEEELFLLRKWKLEGAKIVQDISDIIITIRNKELKSIMATSYKRNTSGDSLGYKIFENYLENISKYSKI